MQKPLGINEFYFGDPDGDWPFPLGAMQMLGKSDATLIGFDVKDAADPAEVARHALDFWLTTEDLPLPDNRVTVDGVVSSTAVNPTLTIIAKSLRVAEVVATRLGTTTLDEWRPSGARLPEQSSAPSVAAVPR